MKKLDPKITVSHNKILNCYNIADDDYCKNNIPLKGYFAFRLGNFFNLSTCDYGTLDKIDETVTTDKIVDDVFHSKETDCHYTYFLPECYVKKEKKFRPYTIAEFQSIFTIGRPIRYRIKNQPDTEKLLIFNGYERNNNKVYIYFGCISYTLEQLFDDFEWQEYYPDDYKPFGMEDGD